MPSLAVDLRVYLTAKKDVKTEKLYNPTKRVIKLG